MRASANLMTLAIMAMTLQLLAAEDAAAYLWPFSNRTGPNRISATLGEYRKGTSPHLHNGVDTTPNSGAVYGTGATKVYAIDSCANGQISNQGSDIETIVCGRFSYTHIKALIPNGATVSAGQIIGELKFLPSYGNAHLHLAEGNGASNPLRNGGLNNFQDSLFPKIVTIEFLRLEGGGLFPTESGAPLLNGKVGIRVKAVDSMSNGSLNVGVYKIGFKVLNKTSGQVVVPENYKTEFLNIYSYPINQIYDTKLSDNSNYFYWVTNNLAAEYWDSSKVADGSYKIQVIVRDICGNQVVQEKGVIIRNGLHFLSSPKSIRFGQ